MGSFSFDSFGKKVIHLPVDEVVCIEDRPSAGGGSFRVVVVRHGDPATKDFVTQESADVLMARLEAARAGLYATPDTLAPAKRAVLAAYEDLTLARNAWPPQWDHEDHAPEWRAYLALKEECVRRHLDAVAALALTSPGGAS